MRALDAEVHDPKIRMPPRSRERGFTDGVIDATAALVANGADDPQHDVYRISRMKIRSLLVRRTGSWSLRRATGAAPLPAPFLEQYQLFRFLALRTYAGRGWSASRHEG